MSLIQRQKLPVKGIWAYVIDFINDTRSNYFQATCGNLFFAFCFYFGCTITDLYAQTVQSFTYTGTEQLFTVPPNVTSLHIVAKGAKGNGSGGGKGGIVEADMQVSPGQVLTIVVGGAGGYFDGGFNGGGAEDWTGGGATDIRVGGPGLEGRKLVAGGGGGGDTGRGGNGGGLVGEAGEAFNGQGPGGGGTQTEGGAGGIASALPRSTQVINGDAGTLGSGGRGEDSGGGGGYYGGGGGGFALVLSQSFDFIRNTAGGGGGSSYADPTLCSNVIHTQGGNTESNGSLLITYEQSSLTLATAATPTTVCAGSTVALSVSVTGGDGPYSYTWVAPAGGSITGSGNAVTGSVSSTVSGIQNFTVSVADSGTNVTTRTISVTVIGINITSQPGASSLVCIDGSVSVTVSASGAIDSYQWYKEQTPVLGQASATLSLSPVTLSDAGAYRLVITGSCNSVTTTAFQLIVSETLGITSQPAVSSTVCPGVAVSVPASVSGIGATYQWYKGSTPVASQTTSTLSLTNPGGSDTGSYSLVATGGCNSVTTDAFSLSVIEVGNFTQQPASNSAVCVGGAISVPTTVTGAVASYQWYKGATPVASQTTNTLSLTGLGVGDEGDYRLVATLTTCGSLTSNAFSLTFNPNPTVTISASPGLAVLPGSSVTLTAAGASSYQWSANTNNASGATVVTSTTGVYSVTGTAAGCTGTTSITLIGLVPPTLSASSSVVCEGSMISVAGITPQTVTYQWLKDGVSLGAGYQSATLTLGGLLPAQSGVYALVVSSGGASVTSTESFSLTVNPLPTVVLFFSGATQSLQGGNLPIITLTNPLDQANLPQFQVLGGMEYQRWQTVDRIQGYEIRKSQINGTGVFTIDQLGPYTITVTGENGCSRTVTGVIQSGR